MIEVAAGNHDTVAYKIAPDDLLAHHKVDILFHALAAGVIMQEERRVDALVETKAGRRSVRASIYVGCSGDGDLAALRRPRTEARPRRVDSAKRID